mgnify:CR=1 FL=1
MPSGSAIGTLRAEWQCDSHCHSTVNVLRITFKAEWQCDRYARGRVAVKGWGLGTLGAEWQCGRDCQTGVSVPNRYARGRVAVKGWGLGTLGAEWQCISHCHSPVNVLHVAFKAEWQCNRYARGRVAVRPGLPNARERTKSVRSGPSGSEGMRAGYARGRVAVHLTLPLAGERTGLHVQGRVAVRTERSRSLTVQVRTTFGPVGITSASGNSPSGAYPEPSPETTPEREEISLQTGWFLDW